MDTCIFFLSPQYLLLGQRTYIIYNRRHIIRALKSPCKESKVKVIFINYYSWASTVKVYCYAFFLLISLLYDTFI